MTKYVVLFNFTAEAIKGFVAKPSDRVAIVRGLAESSGGGLDSYYWMFGQYDGLVIVDLPDSKAAAALSLAITSSGSFQRYETHELIEPGDLSEIAERARGLSYQPPSG